MTGSSKYYNDLVFSNGKIVSGNKFVLLLDALRIHLKQFYDPISVVASGRIDPLPHQFEAFHFLMSFINDSIRILLADDVGLGKTITTGLVIKEILLRNPLARILIIPPASLQLQWQREMEEKFGEHFHITEGSSGDTLCQKQLIISSLQYLRRDERQEQLHQASRWDFVIFDEAHRLTARKSNELATYLSSNCRHLLLLSATPHDGKTEHFISLLRLLDPSIDENTTSINETVKRLVLRRLKNTVTDFDGKYLFPNIPITTQISVSWEREELSFYHKAEEYILFYYLNPDTLDKYQNIIFILLVLMRRISSSLTSGLISLRRRLHRIERAILGTMNEDDISSFLSSSELIELYEEAVEEDDDLKREEVFEQSIQDVDRPISSLMTEKIVLEEIIDYGERLLEKQLDSKTQALLNTLASIKSDKPNDKIIIFTEFVDTLLFLKEMLDPNFTVYTIHGRLTKDEKLVQEEGFRQDGQILLGTDAAGEGLNLQIANIIINYELPWNPNRFQQRIGRVYRYGQDPEKPIHVFNFISSFKIEERVLGIFYRKINTIREDLGESSADLLGTLISQGDVNRILKVAIENLQQAEVMIEDLFKEKIALLEKINRNYLVANNLHSLKVKELPLTEIVTSYDLERFILLCLTYWNVSINQQDEVYSLITFSLPKPVSSLTYQLNLHPIPLKKFNGELPSHIRFHFKPELNKSGIDFINVRHPLLECCLAQILDKIQTNSEGRLDEIPIFLGDNNALIFVNIMIIRNEEEEILYQQPLIAILAEEKDPKWIHPLEIWNFQEKAVVNITPEKYDKYFEYFKKCQSLLNRIDLLPQPQFDYGFKLLKKREEIERLIESQKSEVLLQKTDNEIKQAQNSLATYRIPGLNARLERQQKEAIENLERINQKYNNLKTSIYGPLAVGLVIPESENPLSNAETEGLDYEEIKRIKKQVELAAMDYVLKYENNEGRNPIDVSKDIELGYDIESFVKEIRNLSFKKSRLIEVKGLKQQGNPQVSSNEWRVASLKPNDFYLYVIFNALSQDKEFYIIPNPCENLKDFVTKKPIIKYIYEVNKKGLGSFRVV